MNPSHKRKKSEIKQSTAKKSFFYLILYLISAIATSGCGNQLWSAVNSNDPVKVQVLLEKGADVNSKGYNGTTPLYQASFRGNAEIANMLITKGADVDFKTDRGFTPLYVAAQEGHAELVQRLLAAGAGINSKTNNGSTALLRAAEKGHGEIVKIMIASGADINSKTNSNYTVMHAAAFGGNIELLKIFFDSGLDINLKDKDGRTPLHMSAQNNKAQAFNFLMDHGAKTAPVLSDHITAMMNKLSGGYYEKRREYQLASKCFSTGAEYFNKLADKYAKKAKEEAAKAANPPSLGLAAQLMAANSGYARGSAKMGMLAENYEYPLGRHNAVNAWNASAKRDSKTASNYRTLAEYCQFKAVRLSKKTVTNN